MEAFLKTISALNDETRIKLLYFIKLHGPMCVCDLQEAFKMIQSRLSRHLKILKDAGFLEVKRRGTWAYYSVKDSLDEFKIEALKELEILDCDLPILDILSLNKKFCNIL